MSRSRTVPYAVVAAMTAAVLAACGSSGGGPSSTGPSYGPTEASSAPAASGQGDLQLRRATSAQTPAQGSCSAAPVPPEKPTYRCDKQGAGYQLGPAFVTGAMVVSAAASVTQDGAQVEVTLDAAGTKALAAATTEMSTQPSPQNLLGIMSAGYLYAAAQVKTPVTNGVFVITGLANLADAKSLAASING